MAACSRRSSMPDDDVVVAACDLALLARPDGRVGSSPRRPRRRTPTSSWRAPIASNQASRCGAATARPDLERQWSAGVRALHRLIEALRSVTGRRRSRRPAQRQHHRRPVGRRGGGWVHWPRGRLRDRRRRARRPPGRRRPGDRRARARRVHGRPRPGRDLDPAGDGARPPRRLPRRRPDVRDLPLGRPQPAGVRVRRRPGLDGVETSNVDGRHSAWIASGRDVVVGDRPS